MKHMKRLLHTAGIAVLCMMTGCSSGNSDDLKVLSTKTVELGDPVSLNASDYLLSEPDQDVLKNITVDSDLKTDDSKYTYNGFQETVVSKGKDYLKTGTYDLTLKYDGKDYPVTLTVKDTVMPEFISPSAVVTIPVGNTDFNFKRVFRTSDKDDVEISVDGFYNLNKEGTYPVTVVATDASGNSNSIEITINVVGGNTHITASDQFDDEMVPSEEESETVSEEPQESEESTAPVIPDAPAPETPQTPSVPTACSVSSMPSGTEVYYSFSDLYAAGTAWNQLSPDNYFFYLEGNDDCGNKVYFLSKGSGGSSSSGEATSQSQQNISQAQAQSEQIVTE